MKSVNESKALKFESSSSLILSVDNHSIITNICTNFGSERKSIEIQ